MKVMKLSDVAGQEATSKLFKGRVVRQTISETERLGVAVINFDRGAVNVFHTHSTDQILFVVDGVGIVATEQEEVRVTPGAFIVIPAGERHWHGATEDTLFSHISIRPPGETVY